MNEIKQKLLLNVKNELLLDEAITIKSVVPKYHGTLTSHYLQYAIVDPELEQVTLLPSFLRNMEDVFRFIKTAELIHTEAIEMYKGTI